MRTTVLVGLLAVLWTGSAQGAPRVVWGVNGGGGNAAAQLFRIDATNGTGVAVGAVGFGITGLAVDPTTGTMYGVTNNANPRQLVTIDRATGTGTPVGAFPLNEIIADLAFDASGQLFGWSEDTDDLVRINKATAAVTPTSDAGISTRGSGLAFCGSTLFLAADDANGPLRTVDPVTGLTTATVTLNGTASERVGALDCQLDGVLLGISISGSGAGTSTLFDIDTPATSGDIDARGATPPVMDALAIDEVAVRMLQIVPTAATVGQQISFSAQVEATSPATLSWSFGDGGVANGETATHTYAAPGTYDVVVTATAAGPVDVSQTIKVSIKAPVAGARQILWGVDGSGFGTLNATPMLYRIDTANGAATVVGPTGIRLTGIAVHPTTRALYGVTGGCDLAENCSSTPPNKLVTIDKTTGAATEAATLNDPVTTSTFNVLADIAFDASGTLFGWNEDSDDLFTVNLTTGVITKIGEAATSTYGSGLAFDQTGALFLAGRGNDDNFFALNPSTGILTVLGVLTGATGPAGSAISAMSARADGTLFGAELDENSSSTDRATNLITIDKTTRAVTTIGATVHRLDAIEFEPVTSPAIASAAASPNPAGIGQQVTFTASASSPSGLPLTFIWDFGDGQSGTGNPATHTYAAGGIFNVVLTVDDGNTGTVTQQIQQIVAQPLTLGKFKTVLNFAKSGKDSVTMKGNVTLPAGFNAGGAQVTVDVGGAQGQATLNAKGKSSLLKVKKNGKLSVKLRGSLAAALADEGLTNENASGKPVSIQVLINIGGNFFFNQRSATYNAKANKKGTAK